MNEGKQARSHHRENRHGFGGPADGITKGRSHQIKNRGNHGPSMTDSDPENKISDINPPGNGLVNTAPFQAVYDLNDPGKDSHT